MKKAQSLNKHLYSHKILLDIVRDASLDMTGILWALLQEQLMSA